MTKSPKISIIAALVSKDRAIGNKGQLLVRISDDLKRFKKLTTGHPIIMGRKTYESIGKPLPNRRNIVISRNPDFKKEGIIVVNDLPSALKIASLSDEVFIIGGGEIYKEALPFADKLYLTIVETEAEADAFFPNYSEFKKVIKKESRRDEKSGLTYDWVDLEK